MRKIILVAFMALVALALLGQKARVTVKAADLKWGEGPPSLPKGAQTVVLEGDPSAEGIFTMRIKLPANYRIAPHWHPSHERLTVLEGSYAIGHGESFDEASLTELSAGAFSVMPAGMRHYGWTKNGVTFQVHAMGPWQLIYVNPADDPRTAKK